MALGILYRGQTNIKTGIVHVEFSGEGPKLTPVCINISKHNVNLIYMSALFENIASYLNEKKTIQH